VNSAGQLTKLEMQVLEALWQKGACSVREAQEAFPEPGRPGLYNFEAVISRKDAQRRLVDELMAI
jgi:BlaI family penicillinase repressor